MTLFSEKKYLLKLTVYTLNKKSANEVRFFPLKYVCVLIPLAYVFLFQAKHHEMLNVSFLLNFIILNFSISSDTF